MTKVWETMNELEMVTSKVCSAREIIDVAVDAIQAHQNDKAETLMNAAYEFLGYYLDEFDKKFKDAWQETVGKQKTEEDPCMPPWGHSDLEYALHHDDKIKEENLVRSWHINVEEAYNKEGETIFSYIQLPDSLLERMEVKEGDQIQWIVNPDNTVTIRKF